MKNSSHASIFFDLFTVIGFKHNFSEDSSIIKIVGLREQLNVIINRNGLDMELASDNSSLKEDMKKIMEELKSKLRRVLRMSDYQNIEKSEFFYPYTLHENYPYTSHKEKKKKKIVFKFQRDERGNINVSEIIDDANIDRDYKHLFIDFHMENPNHLA